MARGIAAGSPDADAPRPLAYFDLAKAAVGQLRDERRQEVAGEAVDGVVVDLSLVGGPITRGTVDRGALTRRRLAR
jgi:hypothetical protein